MQSVTVTRKNFDFQYRGSAPLVLNVANAPWINKVLKIYRPSTGTALAVQSFAGAANGVTPGGAVTTLVPGFCYRVVAAVYDGSWALPDAVLVDEIPTASNSIPTANAGADNTLAPGITSVILNGSGADSDGSISSYSWSKIAGPAAYSFSSTGVASPTVTGLIPGEYTFRLIVADNAGAHSIADDVKVTVVAAATSNGSEGPLAFSSGDEVQLWYGQSNITYISPIAGLYDPKHQLFDFSPSLTRAFARGFIVSNTGYLQYEVQTLQARVNHAGYPNSPTSNERFAPTIPYADTFHRQNSNGNLYQVIVSAPGQPITTFSKSNPDNYYYSEFVRQCLFLKNYLASLGKPWKPSFFLGQAETGGDSLTWKPTVHQLVADLKADGVLLDDTKCGISLIKSATDSGNLDLARQHIQAFVDEDARFKTVETRSYQLVPNDLFHYEEFSAYYHAAYNVWNTMHGVQTQEAFISPKVEYTTVAEDYTTKCGGNNATTYTRARQAVSLNSFEEAIELAGLRARTAAKNAIVCVVAGLPPTITSFAPAQAASGDTVTVEGTNLTGLQQLMFGAVPGIDAVALSETTATVKVPAGVTATTLTAVTSSGSGTSATSFTNIDPNPTKGGPTAAYLQRRALPFQATATSQVDGYGNSYHAVPGTAEPDGFALAKYAFGPYTANIVKGYIEYEAAGVFLVLSGNEAINYTMLGVTETDPAAASGYSHMSGAIHQKTTVGMTLETASDAGQGVAPFAPNYNPSFTPCELGNILRMQIEGDPGGNPNQIWFRYFINGAKLAGGAYDFNAPYTPGATLYVDSGILAEGCQFKNVFIAAGNLIEVF